MKCYLCPSTGEVLHLVADPHTGVVSSQSLCAECYDAVVPRNLQSLQTIRRVETASAGCSGR